ncbi:DNA repair protein RadC [Microaerobacter geothermalis]|uniref:RadC family protein n=1 Tax=Microaerobacter geothermalis TaxID=674972 RepID=UPI001F3B0567|nr:DNA repair protein RadC [Microaerobacter geothermalis]MCF6092705.1 DNA repair protein RadC [Microaerobacter geothermalis]
MIRDVPVEERPRERLMEKGPEALSNAELIAILLRTGSNNQSAISLAQQILEEREGLRGLAEMSFHDLTQWKGVGPAKAVQVVAGIELGKRLAKALPESRYTIRSPHDAAQYMMDELRFAQQEHFVVLFLNTKNQVIGKKIVFIGSLNASIVHPREVFREAIRRSSASLICLHNHPSGDPTPSREDIQVTKRLKEAGEIMGIELLDHIVIGDGNFISLKEKGYI